MTLFSLFFVGYLAWYLGRRVPVEGAQGGEITAPSPSATPDEIQVGVYNIHRARGTDGRKDLSRIAKQLARTDIAGLCEVQGWADLRRNNQATLLANQLGLAGLFFPAQKRWLHYDRGNGLLSRFPIHTWQREPLRDSVGNHARCLGRADIRIGDTDIPVYVTHLARRADQEVQLRAVFERFSQHDCAIMMGDFNMDADFPLLQELIQTSGAQDALSKVPSDKDQARIDWILCKGFEVIDAGVENSVASDHPYYWCRLRKSSRRT